MRTTTFEPGRLVTMIQMPEQVEVTELDSGVIFPMHTVVTARYGNGPILTVTVVVEDRRPVVSAFTIARDDENRPPAITASVVDKLPIGQILEEIIGRLGTGTLALYRASQAAQAGIPHRFLTPDEASAAREGAVGSQRGRPPSDRQIRLAAQIAEINPWDRRKQVANQLMVSERTASRLIAEAIRRGYLQ